MNRFQKRAIRRLINQQDNVWVYHRPRALESSAASGLGVAGTNEVGIPVDGLGDPRPFAGSAALSTDPGQTCLYVADPASGTFYVINRENLHEWDRIGRSGRQIG